MLRSSLQSRSAPNRLCAARSGRTVHPYLTHLAIGGGPAEAVAVVGKALAETDAASVVELVAEGGAAQRAGEAREDVGGGGLVVPDVCAASVAAAGVVVGAFEAVEFAVGGAEADGRDQGGEAGAGAVLALHVDHGSRKVRARRSPRAPPGG